MSDNVAREGKPYKYEGLEFWADNGMITVAITKKAEDSKCSADEAFKRIPPMEFLKRAAAVKLYHMTDNCPPSERVKADRFMENAEKAVKLALKQGDPTDPKVIEHVIMTPIKNRITVPGLPYNIRMKDNPRQTLLEGYNLVPDFKKIAT